MDIVEIKTKLAKIEGFDFYVAGDNVSISIPVGRIRNHNHWSYGYSDWNPLGDDALCYQLMIKYKITCGPCPIYEGRYIAFGRDINGNNILPKVSDSLASMAICAAIIKAQEAI